LFGGGGTHNCHDDSLLEEANVIYGFRDNSCHDGLVCCGEGWWTAPGDGDPCP
jgi:hypothetical protein